MRQAHHMDAQWLERITIEPRKCGGRPCNGASTEEILAEFAFLEREDVQAALLYASRLTS